MTEKELKHLSKTEMLGIMLHQEAELNTLKDSIRELESRLNTRTIAVSQAGSIAEAALVINKVMEAAQLAADQYLDNIRALSEKQTSICQSLQSESMEMTTERVPEEKEFRYEAGKPK